MRLIRVLGWGWGGGGGGGGSVGSREDHSCGGKLCRKINLQLL